MDLDAAVARAGTGFSPLFQEVSTRPAEPLQSCQPCPGSWCSGGAGLWAAMTSSCRPSSSSSCTPPGESQGSAIGLEDSFLTICPDSVMLPAPRSWCLKRLPTLGDTHMKPRELNYPPLGLTPALAGAVLLWAAGLCFLISLSVATHVLRGT